MPLILLPPRGDKRGGFDGEDTCAIPFSDETQRSTHMGSPPLSILCCTTSSDKTMVTGPVQCSGCGDRYRHRRHGTYERFLPDSNERVLVQRYLCRNRDCCCATFSILPYPCLRYKRHTLATFGKVTAEAKTGSVKQLAGLYKKGWTAMRRLIRASQQVLSFFLSEREHQLWGPCPCREPGRFWTIFTQAQSYATLPGPT